MCISYSLNTYHADHILVLQLKSLTQSIDFMFRFLHPVLILQESEALISQKIHPQTIISGWRKATDEARKALQNFARDNG